jgi:uncharacterized protein (DUF1697 family)
MTRYIALLRGINVGGNTKVSMPELKVLFESLGFESVKTYINSGNVGFDVKAGIPGLSSPRGSKGSMDQESPLVEQIEKSILERFSLPIQVMVRGQKAIETILSDNPFAGEFETHKEMHVLFMKEEMPGEKAAQLLEKQTDDEHFAEKQTDDEHFAVRGTEIYCHLKLGVADSLLGRGFVEKKLKVPITARNWRTVQKLAEL